jgi:hypothetical protein
MKLKEGNNLFKGIWLGDIDINITGGRGSNKKWQVKNCEWCGDEYYTPFKKQRFCSLVCGGEYTWSQKTYTGLPISSIEQQCSNCLGKMEKFKRTSNPVCQGCQKDKNRIATLKRRKLLTNNH